MPVAALDRATEVCLGTFEGVTPYAEPPREAIVAEPPVPLVLRSAARPARRRHRAHRLPDMP
ncbi:hypothetical protein [Halomonas maura]|uniref:hypothetical protein n=1 Tax=Halomonas maura TaxID=117606 RepID=UPI0025B4399F|nr:hypothetical protein [Halomonas maura]MDN3557481.1 hypothetical protein [Halomonas maura]